MTTLIDLPPYVRILLAAAQAGATVDYVARAGASNQVTIRHSRNRKPVASEKPSLTLLFVSDDPRGDDRDVNDWETVRLLVFDVQADADLSAEDSNLDPTGLGTLGRMIGAFIEALKDPVQPTFLGGLVDWISAGSVDPDERSTPDEGRMTRALTVVYRVRSDDPNVLLFAGANL